MMKCFVRAGLVVVIGGIGLVGCDRSETPQKVEPEAAQTEPAATPPQTMVEEETAASTDEAAADAARKTLADIISDPDAFSRAKRLAEWLPTLGPEGVAAAQEALENNALDLDAAERELLVRYWATQQPEIATTWAVTSTPVHRIPAVACALSIWAEADPLAAAAGAQLWMNGDPGLAKFLPIALVRGWYANGDSPELQQYIHGLGGFTRLRALATYVRMVIQSKGPVAVERWAESLPEDDKNYKLAAHRQIASVLPMFDREASMHWCEEHCDGPYGKNLRSLIARGWALEDGQAALDWLMRSPEGAESNRALRATYSLWGRMERQAALDWMSRQIAEGELNPRLDPILSLYALFVAEDSPKDAIQFAMRLQDEHDRANVLILIVREWRKSDPEASEAWIQQSPLSEEDRARARRDSTSLAPSPPDDEAGADDAE